MNGLLPVVVGMLKLVNFCLYLIEDFFQMLHKLVMVAVHFIHVLFQLDEDIAFVVELLNPFLKRVAVHF